MSDGSSLPPPLRSALDEQQTELVERLRAARGAPVSFEELREAGFEYPAMLGYELGAIGIEVERVARLDPAGGDPPSAGLRLVGSAVPPETATTLLHPLPAGGEQTGARPLAQQLRALPAAALAVLAMIDWSALARALRALAAAALTAARRPDWNAIASRLRAIGPAVLAAAKRPDWSALANRARGLGPAALAAAKRPEWKSSGRRLHGSTLTAAPDARRPGWRSHTRRLRDAAPAALAAARRPESTAHAQPRGNLPAADPPAPRRGRRAPASALRGLPPAALAATALILVLVATTIVVAANRSPGSEVRIARGEPQRRTALETPKHTAAAAAVGKAASTTPAQAPAASTATPPPASTTPATPAPPSPVPASPPQAAPLQMQGHQLLAQGRYAPAVATLRSAMAASGGSPAECSTASSEQCLTYAYALYDLGKALLLDGDPRDAVGVLTQRLQIDNQREVVAQELAIARAALAGGAVVPAVGHGHGHDHGQGHD
ncbi:MAG TPA: hypothetical protein VHT27_04910 [Solirubrobacteraceae bacterium]|nr:hypothetical protein [Solirubrobacteraceae bacterium]